MTTTTEPNSGLFTNENFTSGQAGWADNWVANQKRIGRIGFQLTIIDRDLTAPPGSPSDGDTYIPASVASGDWTGLENHVVVYELSSTSWIDYTPREGWTAFVSDENVSIGYNGSAWFDMTFSLTAGGVLSGTYPNPGFAVDMATQSELDAHTGDTANPHSVTKAQVGLTDAEDKTFASGVADATHAATSKSTPVDADELPVSDSAASWAIKKLTWSNIKATLKTYFDTLYATVSHTHAQDSVKISQLVASDGSPDPAVSVDAAGKVGIGTASPDANMQVSGTGVVLNYTESTDGGPVQIRMRTDSSNRRFLAVDNSDVTESQVEFAAGLITFAGTSFVADKYLELDGSGATVTGDIMLPAPTVPGSASATGTAGTISWDANFLYVCVSTDTWKRVGIATW
jgi:hypothetical protein